jgi:lipopolysaccharide transport system ATP-binding protein
MGTISVSNLGKAYKQYPTRFSRLVEWLDPRNKPRHQLKWVLQDIHFTVQAGEAVGIIGINGAGKSTLLKLITGTTLPTTGAVLMTGRVAAMLELGMGFHPDFTGRQNALMASQLLGITTEEIIRLMPEIEAFAEIGDYIDQPVRVYSSGMQMRLAFSVATAIRPDILIVDEALSVGDAQFQHKSFDRIREFRKQGTTLLIVSHDKQAIQSICDRAILLNAGRIAMEGDPENVLDYYNALIANVPKENSIKLSLTGSVQESGTGDVKISEVFIKNLQGENISSACVGDFMEVHVTINIMNPIDSLVLGCGFKDRYGQMIFGTNSYYLGGEVHDCVPGEVYEFVVACRINLGVGSYSLNLAAHAGQSHLMGNYHWIDRAAILEVVNCSKYEFVGVSWNPMSLVISKFTKDKRFAPIFNMPREEIILAQSTYGPMLVYSNDQVIGKSLLNSGEFQESKILDVMNFIQEEFNVCLKMFIDIGANIGTHTIYALKFCGFESAICFEPNDENVRLLGANISINDLSDRVKLEKIALSSYIGEIEMELSDFNRGDHRIKANSTAITFGEELEREYRVVPVTTINQYANENSFDWSDSLVWIDTQGHEGYIFSGGQYFFNTEKSPKFMVAEFWPYGIERSSGYVFYFDFLRSCKKIYDLSSVNGSGFLEVSVDHLTHIYKAMLMDTKKEHHPHTDLLLVL